MGHHHPAHRRAHGSRGLAEHDLRAHHRQGLGGRSLHPHRGHQRRGSCCRALRRTRWTARPYQRDDHQLHLQPGRHGQTHLPDGRRRRTVPGTGGREPQAGAPPEEDSLPDTRADGQQRQLRRHGLLPLRRRGGGPERLLLDLRATRLRPRGQGGQPLDVPQPKPA